MTDLTLAAQPFGPRARRNSPRFVRAWRRGVLFAAMGAIAGICAALNILQDDIAGALDRVATAAPGETFETVLWAISGPGVFALFTLFAVSAVFLTLAGLAGAFLGATLPPVLAALIDGLAQIALFAFCIHALGIVDRLAPHPLGGLAMVGLYLVPLLALSSRVWDRLPFGFTLQETGDRVIDLPLDAVHKKLLPATAQGQRAGAPVRGPSPAEPKGRRAQVDMDLGDGRLHLGAPATTKAERRLRLRLRETGDGKTLLGLHLTLRNLPPLVMWELWTRPYGVDCLDRLEAAMTPARGDPCRPSPISLDRGRRADR